MKSDFFPIKPEASPSIYAYELQNTESHKGLLKIGYTTRTAKERIEEQLKTARLDYTILFDEPAIRNDGSVFTDRTIHNLLIKKGYNNVNGEWFKISVRELRAAYKAVKENKLPDFSRTNNFKMRPEQEEAVKKTSFYFNSFKKDSPNKTPHFLWNAKMRFGKTFTAYKLAQKMNWSKLLILTFKPAVQSAWEEDLTSHIDFKEWQFISRNGLSFENIDKDKPFVCFGSFQDYLGKNEAGGIKPKNEWVHSINWDCVILDEYHYGAWRENAKDLFQDEDKKEQSANVGEGLEYFDEENMPITTNAYLYLSGTPFRAIATGEFIEEQIYNWTYTDEQKAKTNWKGPNNPYSSLPRVVLMTYQLPDSIKEIVKKGEYNEFDLNEFFSADGKNEDAVFKYEDEVQKWLDLIRGSYSETNYDNLKLGSQKPPMPFSHAPLLNSLLHTFWFLPSVASCYAMANLLKQRRNSFFKDYKVIIAAGIEAGIGVDALEPVLAAMENPLETKTITLSCGKLTTGISVKPWSGIFMLRNTSSPETYFQAAFRVQTPWVIYNGDGKSPNKELIIKNECYVFDFAPDRALRQISEYSCRLKVDETNPEKKVEEFISFLPVLAFDGSSMKQIDAAGVLDMAMSGTTATLLARRWESALLVNVDNNTLRKIKDNPLAMDALSKIEGFRAINQELEIIINKSEKIKKLKAKANDNKLNKKEKKELTEEEKEFKSLRKQIQEKLIKFATRIPVFMYLTDFRENTLKDVITKLEPGLFKKVTGLTVKEFELLVSLNLFNSSLMNDAVYKFKRYEDSSLTYTGIIKHNEVYIGLYDTKIKKDELNKTFVNEPTSNYKP